MVPDRRHARTASSKPDDVPAASNTTSQSRGAEREAERFRGASLRVVAGDDRDVGAEMTRDRTAQQPDRPRADHADAHPRFDPGAVARVQRHRQRFDDRRVGDADAGR